MMSISIHQRVIAHDEKLSPSARRVADFLIDHPERALMATAAEIAAEAGTSDATVIRTIKLLGYGGLAELRREVSEQLATHYNPSETIEFTIDSLENSPAAALNAVLSDTATLISNNARSVDRNVFVRAIEMLTGAPEVVVVGWGTGGAAAEYASISLSRIGIRSRALTASGFRLADDVATLRAGQVILLLAPVLHIHEIDVVLEQANEVGARTILISELLGEKFRGQVTEVMTLAASQKSTASEFISLISVLDAIILGMAASRPSEAKTHWSMVNALRSKFSSARFAESPLL